MLELLLLAMENAEDEKKFTKLYNRYVQFVFAVCSDYLQSPLDIEDAASVAWFKVSTNLSKIADIESKETRAYIATIAMHVCLRMKEKLKKNKSYMSMDNNYMEYSPSTDGIEKHIEENLLYEAYKKCLLKLSVTQYKALYMTHIQGLSVKEIARLTDEKENTVSQRIFVGKKNLIKLMKEELEVE